MAKNLISYILILFLYSCSHHIDKNVPIKGNSSKKKPSVVIVSVPEEKAYIRLQKIYRSQLGVRELTGNNDGPEVEKYLKSTGLGKGHSWCAAFVHWCLLQAGISNTITAWSPTAYNPNDLVWVDRELKQPPLAGDVFTLYSASLNRIHHTGFFDEEVNDDIYQTVEGNTNAGGSANGDGVYERKRSYNATYSITRWLKK